MNVASPRDGVSSLIAQLIEATQFEHAARATLAEILTCAERTLAASEYHASGQLLRAMVHLRPTDSYHRLFGIEHPAHDLVDGMGYLTSASVWRWVSEHGCSVSLDVKLDALHPWLPDDTRTTEVYGTPLTGSATRTRMLDRHVTHVHVMPLKSPTGQVDGMITLEAKCKPAIGSTFIWRTCQRELETLATVASPYLNALPADTSKPETVPKDEFLPVVGKSMASLIEIVRVFADQEETLLISGPTGAGKSRLARWAHEQSQRKPHPFETLDLLSVRGGKLSIGPSSWQS